LKAGITAYALSAGAIVAVVVVTRYGAKLARPHVVPTQLRQLYPSIVIVEEPFAMASTTPGAGMTYWGRLLAGA
jgi:hypothetical protein